MITQSTIIILSRVTLLRSTLALFPHFHTLWQPPPPTFHRPFAMQSQEQVLSPPVTTWCSQNTAPPSQKQPCASCNPCYTTAQQHAHVLHSYRGLVHAYACCSSNTSHRPSASGCCGVWLRLLVNPMVNGRCNMMQQLRCVQLCSVYTSHTSTRGVLIAYMPHTSTRGGLMERQYL